MIPFTTPPVYPPVPPGRFAQTIVRAGTGEPDQPGAAAGVEKCRVALLGLADDTGVAMNHGRPGARDGPAAFRAALSRYGVTARMDEADGAAGWPKVFDAGDVVPGRTLHETHERVTTAVMAVLALGLLPVGVGGGHDLTFPFVRALHRHRRERLGDARPLAGVYADAHLDVRPEPGSGMPFRALLTHGYAGRLVNVGVNRLVTARDHYEFFRAHGGRCAGVEELAAPGALVHGADFASIDLDVLDASSAPGVSALNPAGLRVSEVAGLCEAAGRCASVAAIDFMEFNPVYDADHRTARVLAHLVLSFLSGLAARPGAAAS